MYTAESVASPIIPVIQAAHKSVVIALIGSMLIEKAQELFRHANIPTYPFPERAESTLGTLARRASCLEFEANRPSVEEKPFLIDRIPKYRDAEALVSSYGIPTSQSWLARSADEAAQLAREVGLPVVMKGVLLNLRTISTVRCGYTQMTNSIKGALLGARIDGVSLQRQVSGGLEVIVGVVRDEAFDPLVMFGSGGVEAEGRKDVAFALAPLNPNEAGELISRTWAGRRLNGFRSIPPADILAVQDVLTRIPWLAHEHPEIKEIEINPLRTLGIGAVALDGRMKL